MTIDPFQLYDWVAKIGFPGAMAVFIWALYTRRLHWHDEFIEMKEQMATEYSRAVKYLESRVEELLGERNEFKEMIITSQRATAKSMDTLSLAIEKTKRD